MQAYVYAFPLVYLCQRRYDWTNVPDSSFYPSLNHFHHKKVLSNHINYTSGGSPNQDTLYFWGWPDLRKGPVVLAHPDLGNRYFSFNMAGGFHKPLLFSESCIDVEVEFSPSVIKLAINTGTG